jgi:hypothetical protein
MNGVLAFETCKHNTAIAVAHANDFRALLTSARRTYIGVAIEFAYMYLEPQHINRMFHIVSKVVVRFV